MVNEPDFVGALLGTSLIDLLDQSLIRWLEISEFWRDAILGLLILLAVATDAVLLKRMRLWWARRLQAQSTALHREVPTEAAPEMTPEVASDVAIEGREGHAS